MAEQKQEKKDIKQKPKQEKQEKEKEKKKPEIQDTNEVLVRIFGYDVPGSKNVYAGLTRIKGISWSISNAICLQLGIPRTKRISELGKPEIQKIEEALPTLKIQDFLKNRRTDEDTGKTTHLYGTDLDITKDFDIKKMKKIRSYKGIRHATGQPVRGQRTKSHFRKNKNAMVGRLKKKETKA